jgi:uncharacterized membrane protein
MVGKQVERTALTLELIGGVLIAVLAIATSVLIRRSITRPLNE